MKVGNRGYPYRRQSDGLRHYAKTRPPSSGVGFVGMSDHKLAFPAFSIKLVLFGERFVSKINFNKLSLFSMEALLTGRAAHCHHIFPYAEETPGRCTQSSRLKMRQRWSCDQSWNADGQ